MIQKHWMVGMFILGLFLVLGLLPGLAYPFYLFFVNSSGSSMSAAQTLGVFASLMYLLAISLLVYVKYLNDLLDIVIVTNERIIYYEQRDLFHRQITESHISQIQDVQGEEKGILGSLFHYGNITVRTASQKNLFEIKNVSQPHESSRDLMVIRDQFLEGSSEAAGETCPV